MNDIFDLISDIFSENNHAHETRIQPANETAQTNNNDTEDPFAWLNPTTTEPVQEAEIIEETAIQAQEVEEVSAVLQPSPEIDDGPTEEELEAMARLLSGESVNDDDEDTVEVDEDEYMRSIGSVDNLDPRIRQILASVSDEDLEDLFIGNLNCVTYQYNILSVSREDFISYIQGYRLLNGIVFDDNGYVDDSGESVNVDGFPRNLTPEEERALELINIINQEEEDGSEVNEHTIRESRRHFTTEELIFIREAHSILSGISLSLLNSLLIGNLSVSEIEIPESVDRSRFESIINTQIEIYNSPSNRTDTNSEETLENSRTLVPEGWEEYVEGFISGEMSLATNAPPPGWGMRQFEAYIESQRILRRTIEEPESDFTSNQNNVDSTLMPDDHIASLETWASAPPDYTSSSINAFADFANEDLRETSFGNIGNAELQEVAEATIRDVFIDSLADPNFEVTPENNILNDSPNRYGLVKANYDRFKGADWFTIAQQQTIVLAGLGGIGSWTSLMLSRIGPKTIYAFDDDSFEAHNMSGQLVNLQFLGKPKTFSALHMANQFSNYNGMQIYTERFTKSTKGDKVMICGFDSMSARKDYFESWKREVSSTPEEHRHECLFIDGRLTAELFQIFTLIGNDAYAIQEYEQKFLYDDSIADEEDCTLKQTSHLAAMIGSYMTMHFTNFCSNLSGEDSLKRIPWFLEFNSTTNTYIHEF